MPTTAASLSRPIARRIAAALFSLAALAVPADAVAQQGEFPPAAPELELLTPLVNGWVNAETREAFRIQATVPAAGRPGSGVAGFSFRMEPAHWGGSFEPDDTIEAGTENGMLLLAPVFATDGTTMFRAAAISGAGLRGDTASRTFVVDSTAPTSAATVTSTSGEWKRCAGGCVVNEYTSRDAEVHIALDGRDPLPLVSDDAAERGSTRASGMAPSDDYWRERYTRPDLGGFQRVRVNGGSWQVRNGAAMTLDLAQQGRYFVEHHAVDIAGNQGQIKSFYVTVDRGELPVITRNPQVLGTARDGETLTADTGEWNTMLDGEPAIQWRRCGANGSGCTDIAGQTTKTYALKSGDIGSTLRIVVTASNRAGKSAAVSAATAPVAAIEQPKPPVDGTKPADPAQPQGQTAAPNSGPTLTPSTPLLPAGPTTSTADSTSPAAKAKVKSASLTRVKGKRRARVHITGIGRIRLEVSLLDAKGRKVTRRKVTVTAGRAVTLPWKVSSRAKRIRVRVL